MSRAINWHKVGVTLVSLLENQTLLAQVVFTTPILFSPFAPAVYLFICLYSISSFDSVVFVHLIVQYLFRSAQYFALYLPSSVKPSMEEKVCVCHIHFHDHQQYNFLVQKSSICPLTSLTGPFEVFAVLIDRNGPPPGLCEQLCKMFIFFGTCTGLAFFGWRLLSIGCCENPSRIFDFN